MSPDTQTVADDQVRSAFQRWKNLEEEKARIGDDLKELFAEQKAFGHDTKAMRAAFRLKVKIDEASPEDAEHEALVDTYLAALEAPRASRAYARENIGEFDRKARAAVRTSEAMDDNKAFSAELVAAGLISEEAHAENVAISDAVARKYGAGVLDDRRSDGGLNILTKHEDIRTAPVTAEEICRPANPAVPGGEPSIPSTDAGGEKMDGSSHPGRPDATTLGIISTKSGQATNSHSEMDRATEGSFETGSEAAEKGRKATATVAAPADLSHAGAGESPAAEKATVATQGEATEPTSDDGEATGTYAGEDRAAANAGGDHVDGNALRVPTSATGEGAAKTALPADGVILEYVPPFPMKRLPFAHCFPELSKAEYERLEKDIAANRVREPIIRQGDVIVDGWARYNISRAYGMSYPIHEIDAGRDVLLDVIEWQRAARKLNPAQERKIAADLAKEIPHRADDIMAAFGLAEALEAAE